MSEIIFGEATELDIAEAPGKWERTIRDFLELREPDGTPVKLKVILSKPDIPLKTKMTGLQYAIRKAKNLGEPFPVRLVQRKGNVFLVRVDPE